MMFMFRPAMTLEEAQEICAAANLELIAYSGKARKPSKMRCTVCATEFDLAVGQIRNGRGCPNRRNHEQLQSADTAVLSEHIEPNTCEAPPINPVSQMPIPDGIEIDCMQGNQWHARCTVCGDEWWGTEGCIKKFGCAKCRLEKELSAPFTAEELAEARESRVTDDTDRWAEKSRPFGLRYGRQFSSGWKRTIS